MEPNDSLSPDLARIWRRLALSKRISGQNAERALLVVRLMHDDERFSSALDDAMKVGDVAAVKVYADTARAGRALLAKLLSDLPSHPMAKTN